MSRRASRLAALVSLGVLVPAVAIAYDWQGGKWARNEMPVGFQVSNDLSEDVPDRECLAAVQDGYNVWTALPCSYMRWEFTGRTPNTAWGVDDGVNISSWRESGWDQPSVVLGITSTITNFQGNIQDADIKYNGVDHSWARFGDAPGFDGRTDIASVSAHEVGHALGLGHSAEQGATMWPSTGPGDISGRSLAADDIRGSCEVYPSGGDIPDPGEEPPPAMGDVGFGGDCAMALCLDGLFCVSDGRSQYCSRTCQPGSDECGAGYYCTPLAGGGGACARGDDPGQNLGNFGDECGQERGCAQGLTCVNDNNAFYCTGPCLDGTCPSDFFCAPLQGGGDVCARGEGPGEGGGRQGQPCDERGLCERGLFCLYDPVAIDEATGEVVPYCTTDCPDQTCPDGYRCIDLPPDSQACQKIPSPGQRRIGDPCWVNPERPFDPPTCGEGLVCTGSRVENQEVVERGTCTQNCKADTCCPEGYGCVELTPAFGQCKAGAADSPSFVCTGTRPGEETPDGGLPTGGSSGAGVDGGGGGGGCAQSHGQRGVEALSLFLCVVVGLGLRRRRV